jgi:hypothetical protein
VKRGRRILSENQWNDEGRMGYIDKEGNVGDVELVKGDILLLLVVVVVVVVVVILLIIFYLSAELTTK